MKLCFYKYEIFSNIILFASVLFFYTFLWFKLCFFDYCTLIYFCIFSCLEIYKTCKFQSPCLFFLKNKNKLRILLNELCILKLDGSNVWSYSCKIFLCEEETFLIWLLVLVPNITDRWRFTVINCNSFKKYHCNTKIQTIFIAFQQPNKINIKLACTLIHFYMLFWGF